jgi:hypothetical protein
MVCDADFFSQEPHESKKAEYYNLSANVKNVLVAHNGEAVGSSEVFEAKVSKVNAYTFE